MGVTVGLRAALVALMAAGVAALAACDSGPSAVPARDHSAAAVAEAARQAEAQGAEPRQTRAERAANDDAPLYRGKPIWSSNQKYTAQENAEYHFRRNGPVFGADTTEAFIAKTHAFISDPPKGSLRLTRRNGDRLIYDPKGNVFAVATKDGAPRTMFKPDDGLAYWERQKEREARTAGGERSAARG